MLIVGELINTSRKAIKKAVEERDAAYIQDLTRQQREAGADYIDVNCATVLNDELGSLRWAIENIQAAGGLPCIDTPNPEAMDLGLSLTQGGQPMVNSLSGESERYQSMLPLVLKYKARVIALCLDDQGMPKNADDRVRVARNLVQNLTAAGVPMGDIYLDPLVQPLSTSDSAGLEVLAAIRRIKEEFPETHIICGLSNISYGLPQRKVLNQVFMVQTMTAGMDAYILDPLDRSMMGFLRASQALLGQDPFCMNYLAAFRQGLYEKAGA